jgi:hypothetical protein
MLKLRRPSPSMIVALTALAVALGGTAFAAGVVINGKLLKNGSVTGNKLKKDTLSGTQIKESKLGKVPRATNADRATAAVNAKSALRAATAQSAAQAVNADTVGHLRPDAFVQGGGQRFFLNKSLSANTAQTNAFDIPTLGSVEMTCPSNSQTKLTITNATGQTIEESSMELDSVMPHAGGGVIPDGGSLLGASGASFGQAHIALLWPSGAPRHTMDLTVGWYPGSGSSGCNAIAEGIVR